MISRGNPYEVRNVWPHRNQDFMDIFNMVDREIRIHKNINISKLLFCHIDRILVNLSLCLVASNGKIGDVEIILGRHTRAEMSLNPLTLSQWSSGGLPVAIQCAWNLDPSVHWNATGEIIVGSQCVSSVFQWSSSGFQWSSSVFQLFKLTLDRHWDTTGC